MPHIKANGIRIHYETFGKGPPLILIGGYNQHKGVWQDYFIPLSKKFRVIAIDNRGSGQSDAPNEPYSIRMFARDTAALMENLEIENAHFMGQSMGSAIILKLCLNHPEKVRKAILCAPFAKLPPIATHRGKTLLKLLEMGTDMRMLYKLNASWMLSNAYIEENGNEERFVNSMLHDPFPQSMEGLLGQADALFSCDLRREIHQIPHELLLLVGGKDIATPSYCAKEIADKAQNARIHTFPEMGHLFPWEIPNHVIDQALSFLLQSR